MSSAKEKFQNRSENFCSSLIDLKKAVEQEHFSVLERAGLIQLFEVSFELAWKTLKDLLAYEGYGIHTPRTAIKEAFKLGWLQNGSVWLDALESRNRFSHTYNAELAQESNTIIKEKYAPMLFEFDDFLKRRPYE